MATFEPVNFSLRRLRSYLQYHTTTGRRGLRDQIHAAEAVDLHNKYCSSTQSVTPTQSRKRGSEYLIPPDNFAPCTSSTHGHKDPTGHLLLYPHLPRTARPRFSNQAWSSLNWVLGDQLSSCFHTVLIPALSLSVEGPRTRHPSSQRKHWANPAW